MSELTKDQVVDFLSNLTVIELSNLVSELEEKWGVSAAAAVAVAAGPGGDPPRKRFSGEREKPCWRAGVDAVDAGYRQRDGGGRPF